jgi:hypothetical protein
MKVHHEYWLAEVFIREKLDDDAIDFDPEENKPWLMANFATQELAELAIQWALEYRLEELNERAIKTPKKVRGVGIRVISDQEREILWWGGDTHALQRDIFRIQKVVLDLNIIE